MTSETPDDPFAGAGNLRAAVEKALEQAAGRDVDPVLEALALRMAEVADRAWTAGDHREFIAAAGRLVGLYAALGLTAGGEGGDGGSADWDRGMAELMRSGPQVRNAPDA